MIVVWTSLIPALGVLILGASLATRGQFSVRAGIARLLQGLLIIFAAAYVVNAMNDHQYWRTYWPDTPMRHALGPDWPAELFWTSLAQMMVFGTLFAGSFLAAALWREGKVA